MSFSNVASGQNGNGVVQNQQPRVIVENSSDGMTILSKSLQKYNSAANSLKQLISQQTPQSSNSSLLESKMKDCRDCEVNVKVQINIQMKKLDALSKSNSIQQRLALSKLQKDYERVRNQVKTLMETVNKNNKNDKSNIHVITGNSNNNNNDTSSNDNINNTDIARSGYGGGKEKKIKDRESYNTVVLQKLQGHEVDEAIAERERDIRQINQDLQMVNEMFRDVAKLVEEQNEPINEIAKMTEESHQRAEAGLQQVQQAARYQPGCILS